MTKNWGLLPLCVLDIKIPLLKFGRLDKFLKSFFLLKLKLKIYQFQHKLGPNDPSLSVQLFLVFRWLPGTWYQLAVPGTWYLFVPVVRCHIHIQGPQLLHLLARHIRPWFRARSLLLDQASAFK
jgi:hypothetical protein